MVWQRLCQAFRSESYLPDFSVNTIGCCEWRWYKGASQQWCRMGEFCITGINPDTPFSTCIPVISRRLTNQSFNFICFCPSRIANVPKRTALVVGYAYPNPYVNRRVNLKNCKPFLSAIFWIVNRSNIINKALQYFPMTKKGLAEPNFSNFLSISLNTISVGIPLIFERIKE